VERVLHEVDRPNLIPGRWRDELRGHGRLPQFRPPSEIPPQATGQAPAAFVILGLALRRIHAKHSQKPQRPFFSIAWPSASTTGASRSVQSNPRPIPRCPRQADSRTSARNRQTMCGSQIGDRVALSGQRYSLWSI
jgi:hypothetical protein